MSKSSSTAGLFLAMAAAFGLIGFVVSQAKAAKENKNV